LWRELATAGFCLLGGVAFVARSFVKLPDRWFWAVANRCAESESATIVFAWTKWVATLLTLACGLALTWVVTWLDLWAPIIAWFAAFVGWVSVTGALIDGFGDAIEVGDLSPLFAAIEEITWRARWKETKFRDALLEHLHSRFHLTQRHEAPVERGTSVDLRIAYRGVDWFVTIKKGLSNQKRLMLQGEVEDILAHVRDRKRKFGILVLLGMSAANPGKQETHASSLENHLAERGFAAERYHGKDIRSYVLRLTMKP